MIKIGTRASALAMAQARLVEEAYRKLGYQTEIVPVSNRGDRNLTAPMSELGRDLFVDGFQEKFSSGEIDVAVHSAKDLPAEVGFDGFYAFTRGDVRDVLLSVGEIGRIGTGSARRINELKKFYPQAEFFPIRGNVGTRIAKLRTGEYDAVVLAKAGLDRLNPDLSGLSVHIFSTDECVPSACQGIIAVQGELGRLVEDPELSRIARLERAAQRALGADCASGVGIVCENGLLKGAKNGRHFQVSVRDENAVRLLAEGLS